jgi:predicted nucleotidyltransferase
VFPSKLTWLLRGAEFRFKEILTLPEFIGLERYLKKIICVKVDLVSVGALKGKISARILMERVPV